MTLAASTLQLPPGPWHTVYDCLCAHFPAIPAATWHARMIAGRVLDADGVPLARDASYRTGLIVRYFREVEDELPLPPGERILHADAHLVVADKPHFLPVTPAGRFVRETLLTRLRTTLGNAELVPLHRIDRGTAGLVLFSAHPRSRSQYQALFTARRIRKTYEAIAPALPGLTFPLERASRIVPGDPFFLMREAPGTANAWTRIEVMGDATEAGGVGTTMPAELWRYRLFPATGRKHQLRVHMMAVGAPILDDPFYPALRPTDADDFTRPMQLLARALEFEDPLTGALRTFTSERELQLPGPTSPAAASTQSRRHISD